MKTKIFINLLLALVVTTGTFSFQSCKKYEDGSSLTLLSKNARLVNTWTLNKVYDKDETDITANYIPTDSEYVLTIINNGNYSFLLQSYTNGIESSSEGSTGKWEFSSDKTEVGFTNNFDNQTETFTILKLESKELWYRNDDESSLSYKYEYHFTQSE